MRFHAMLSKLILGLGPTVCIRSPLTGRPSVGELGSEGEQNLFMRAADVMLATAQ